VGDKGTSGGGELVAVPGDNTYSNLQEATRSFWRQTVLPLVDRTTKALSSWLAPVWGERLELRPDLDRVEALSPAREARRVLGLVPRMCEPRCRCATVS
jgi:phage portal protein BeeE